jgi:hypothetical protein
MKANGSGMIIGTAMSAYDGSQSTAQVIVFVSTGYYDGPSPLSYIQNGGNAVLNDLTVGGTANLSDLNVSGNTTINDLTVTGSATIANLTVTGSAQFSGNITIGGHIITSGDAPDAHVEDAAGHNATCTLSGNDTGGSITIVTGDTDLADGTQCTVNFHSDFDHAPNPVVSPRNKDSASAGVFVDADTSKMTIQFAQAPAVEKTYKFNYFNTQ